MSFIYIYLYVRAEVQILLAEEKLTLSGLQQTKDADYRCWEGIRESGRVPQRDGRRGVFLPCNMLMLAVTS